MGATGAVGRITNYVTSTIGSIFGECLHVLGLGEMPAHGHNVGIYDPGHAHSIYGPSGVVANTGYAGGTGNIEGGLGHTSSTNTTGITAYTDIQGGSGSHNNVQPSNVCNYIIRIA
jgi:microcystin-dependent protein